MGGQTASPGTTHFDMRKLNKVLAFSIAAKTIHVQSGIRWVDIQRFINPYNLSVKIMQSYANFTVGGSLSVNAHGRYIGLGPIILSVRRIVIVLADGTKISATETENQDIFYAAIGGYGGIGVIVEAELDLVDNVKVERQSEKISISDYPEYFTQKIGTSKGVVFHNADIYPPTYKRVNSVTWSETTRDFKGKYTLQPVKRVYPIHRYFYWLFTETFMGKQIREYLLDPVLYSKKIVHWRNFEAGYDVSELEPANRIFTTFVLQEYFIPVKNFEKFVPLMAEIFQRHKVNIVNVSVRHALPDSNSLLSWCREEVFAFVVYYKQRLRENAKNRVAVWTREMIDAAISVNGSYYLPYQIHATEVSMVGLYPAGALPQTPFRPQMIII